MLRSPDDVSILLCERHVVLPVGRVRLPGVGHDFRMRLRRSERSTSLRSKREIGTNGKRC